MNIKINGKIKVLEKKINLADLIKKLGLSCDKVVTEYNSRIISVKERETLVLEEDGNLEIISFVGGG
jgi:thiamine biosynthesis protein ThiS